MKKLIIFLISIAFLIGSYRLWRSKKLVKEKPRPETRFKSLKEALNAKFPIKCEIKTKQGKMITVYLKEEKQRIEGVNYDGEGIMINDGKYIYLWNREKKEGIRYTLAKSEEAKSPEEWIKDYKEEKPECKPALIAESTFSPPSNVGFKDLTPKEGLPSSGLFSQEKPTPSQEELERLIKEFEKNNF